MQVFDLLSVSVSRRVTYFTAGSVLYLVAPAALFVCLFVW